MNQHFRTLKDIPAAKRALKNAGFTVTKENMYVNSRPAYRVKSEDGMCDMIVTDYGLLEWASAA